MTESEEREKTKRYLIAQVEEFFSGKNHLEVTTEEDEDNSIRANLKPRTRLGVAMILIGNNDWKGLHMLADEIRKEVEDAADVQTEEVEKETGEREQGAEGGEHES